jgi:hypothetical protein
LGQVEFQRQVGVCGSKSIAEKRQKHAVERKEVIVSTSSQAPLDLQDPAITDAFSWQRLDESSGRWHQLAAVVFPATC